MTASTLISRLRALGAAMLVIGLVAACGSPPQPSLSTDAPRASASLLAAGSGGPATTPTASTGSSSPSAGPSAAPSASPLPNPASFATAVDNPWFPLKPGTVWVYRGTKDGETAIDTVTVTDRTKIVAGVRCVVVHDVLRLGGKVAERTIDWYAQDLDGNVWYYGEATAELDASGKVTSTEGSWQAGVDGARPGIFMPVTPKVGLSGIQEIYAGQAEDRFVVLFTGMKVKVPAGTYSGGMVTAEWTILEPGVLTEKVYIKGIGEVREADVAGGHETAELTKLTLPH